MPTSDPDEPILVGVVARAHGLGGEVVVDPWSDVPDRFAPGSVLWAAAPAGPPRRVTIVAARPFQGRILVRFDGVSDREAAEAFHGAELTIPRSEVAPLPEGRHYRFELMGLTARTADGVQVGEVTEIFSTGSNDVAIIRGPRGEILLPLLPEVVLAVDVEGGTMTVAPPPGLPGWDEE